MGLLIRPLHFDERAFHPGCVHLKARRQGGESRTKFPLLQRSFETLTAAAAAVLLPPSVGLAAVVLGRGRLFRTWELDTHWPAGSCSVSVYVGNRKRHSLPGVVTCCVLFCILLYTAPCLTCRADLSRHIQIYLIGEITLMTRLKQPSFHTW